MKKSWILTLDSPLTIIGLALELAALWFLLKDQSFVIFAALLVLGAFFYRIGRRPTQAVNSQGSLLQPVASQDDPVAWTQAQKSPTAPGRLKNGQTLGEFGEALGAEMVHNLNEASKREGPPAQPLVQPVKLLGETVAPETASPVVREDGAGAVRHPRFSSTVRVVIGLALLGGSAIAIYPPWNYTFSGENAVQVVKAGPRAPIWAPPAPERGGLRNGVVIDLSRLLVEWFALGAMAAVVCTLLPRQRVSASPNTTDV